MKQVFSGGIHEVFLCAHQHQRIIPLPQGLLGPSVILYTTLPARLATTANIAEPTAIKCLQKRQKEKEKQGQKLVSSDAQAVEVLHIIDIVDIVGIIDTVDIFSNLEQCYAVIEAISKTLVNHPLN